MKLKAEKQAIHNEIKRKIASAEHQTTFWREVLFQCEPPFAHEAAESLKSAWSHFDDINKEEREFLMNDDNFDLTVG